MLYNIVLVFHVLVAVGLVVMVLLQQGKGADAGAAFGAGASGTVFGSRGAGNFLTRSTAVLATLFFVLSLALFTLAKDLQKPETSLIESTEQQRPAATVPETRREAPVDVPVTD